MEGGSRHVGEIAEVGGEGIKGGVMWEGGGDFVRMRRDVVSKKGSTVVVEGGQLTGEVPQRKKPLSVGLKASLLGREGRDQVRLESGGIPVWEKKSTT